MKGSQTRNEDARMRSFAGDCNGQSIQGDRMNNRLPAALNRPQQIVREFSFNGLLTNQILTALPGEDFARLLPQLEPVSLVAGENLYVFAEDIHFVYFPENVVISQVYILEDGSTTEAAMIGKDGMVGLSAIFGSAPPPYSTQVTLTGGALRISAGTLRQEFARSAAVQRLLLRYASLRLMQLSQRAICSARHTLEKRFCSWLLMVHERSGEDQLALTHEHIAHLLGTRRAGITGVIATLRDKHIIGCSRGHIRVLDLPALEAAACECYRALSEQTLATP
jgi:CRP-like cAMP-binding protein